MHRVTLWFALWLAAGLNVALTQPKLVVLISVDQMREEYFERYGNEFTGGLKRLASEGVFFTNAELNYAASETGPGHASLSTGTYPARSGIFENNWTDRRTLKRVYCVSDSTAGDVDGEGKGFSPALLLTTSFGDWLKSASPTSKVITASGKNRAAILLGGKRANYAFWYEKNSGHMVTSSYYTASLPAWAKEFNAQNWVQEQLPPVWSRLMPDSVYVAFGPDSLEGEMLWDGKTTFPHFFQPGKRFEQILTSPYEDQLVLDFARRAVVAERLGQRGVTDVLGIGLSATDYIGHNFGPDSHEQHDNLLRLDLALGAFIADVESVVGRGNVLIVLSADHACVSLPEYLTKVEHRFARRIMVESEIRPKIDSLDASLRRELHSNKPIIEKMAYLNYDAARNANLSLREMERQVHEGLLKIDGIADVYFRDELLDQRTPDRPYLDAFRRSYSPERGEDFQIRYAEHCLVTHDETGTEHGSPYRYDTHIPIIFWGEKFSVNRTAVPAHTVDVAPTIAKLIGINAPANLDGHPLKDVMQ